MEDRIKEIEDMKLKGLSYSQIGKYFDLSRQRIQQLLEPSKAIKTIISDRSKGKCESCGYQLEKSGHYHHKLIPGIPINSADNLSYLCVLCHITLHWNDAKIKKGNSTALTLARKSLVQQNVINKLKEVGQITLHRFYGDFWTYPNCPIHQGIHNRISDYTIYGEKRHTEMLPCSS
jgi:hypothetical protein